MLQIIDLSPIIKYKHDLVTKSIVYETPLKSSVWDDLGKTYKNIIFYKPTMNLYCNEFGYVFEDYALKYNLTLNAVYLARDITAYKDNEVTEHFEKLANGARYDENIYIFQNEDNIPKRNYGLNYYKIDNYIIGITGKINNEKALNLVK